VTNYKKCDYIIIWSYVIIFLRRRKKKKRKSYVSDILFVGLLYHRIKYNNSYFRTNIDKEKNTLSIGKFICLSLIYLIHKHSIFIEENNIDYTFNR